LAHEEKDECMRAEYIQTAKTPSYTYTILKRRFSSSAAKDGIHLDQELHNDMKQMIMDCTDKINHSYQPDTFQHLLGAAKESK